MRRIALVTGASRGIGRAVAVRLARDGYALWVNYRQNDEAARETEALIREAGSTCTLMKFDVGDPGAVRSHMAPAVEALDAGEQRLEVLVNNAGITRDGILAWMKDEDWSDVIDTNLGGLFNVTRAAVSAMINQKHGRIVNMTSVSGRTGNQGQTNYSTTKAGIIGFTRSLAREVGRFGVTANAVAPGFIESEMTRDLPASEIRKNVPVRRLGKPGEVAHAVSFLCSTDAAYINGAVIDVNGGLF